jgi:ComEC/Rec2-related protein
MIGRLLPIPVGLWLGILCSLVLALGSTSWRVFLIALVAALALVFLRAPIQVRQSLLIAIPFLIIGLFLGWLKAAAVTDSTIQKLINDSTPGIAVFEIRSDPVQIQGKYETSQAVQVNLMALIGLMALFLGRPRIPSVALITAVTVLLLFDPWLALSWGFALSVSATAGIVWFAPALVAQVQERWPQAPKYLVLAIALTVSAQVATAPLVAALGNNSLIVGVPANLLAMPVVPFITLGGLLVTFVAPVTPGLASVLANLVSPMADWVGLVARTGAKSWLASVPWPSGPAGAAATTGLIVATVLLAVAIKSRRLTRFGARALAARSRRCYGTRRRIFFRSTRLATAFWLSIVATARLASSSL